jgi:hypothetical protein
MRIFLMKQVVFTFHFKSTNNAIKNTKNFFIQFFYLLIEDVCQETHVLVNFFSKKSIF